MDPKELEKCLSDTRDDVHELKGHVKEIRDALRGNNMGNDGLIKQIFENVRDIKEVDEKLALHIKELDEKKNKVKGGVTVLAFLWSLAMFLMGLLL